MDLKSATRYMQWCYEKTKAGIEELTEEELELMDKARQVGLGAIKKFMRLTEDDWKYTPGKPFEW
mgnify:CR=1 FL=1